MESVGTRIDRLPIGAVDPHIHGGPSIAARGIDQTPLCSDLGQAGVLSPLEGLHRGIRLCMDLDCSDDDTRKMVPPDAACAAGLEADLPQE